jgi:hypothetical protein
VVVLVENYFTASHLLHQQLQLILMRDMEQAEDHLQAKGVPMDMEDRGVVPEIMGQVQ